MARLKITKRTVDAAEAGVRDTFLWDDELRGFGLKVTPAGKRVYIIQYRIGGRGSPTKRYTIGPHGVWTPARARQEAEDLLSAASKGIDLNADKAERNRIAVDLAFSDYADKFLSDYVKDEWPSSYDFAEGILRLHVKPVLKQRPLPSIKRTDIAAILDRLPTRQAALRRNVYAVVRRLFRWALGRGDIPTNPLEGFETPAGPKSRERVLSDDELRLVWLAAGALGYPFGPFYRLLLLTGQRREEVSALPWSELDRSIQLWRLPGERAKNGNASNVPLNDLAINIIDGIAGGEKWKRRGLVFTTNDESAISGYSRGKKRLDREILKLARKEAQAAGENPDEATIDPWRIHDLRRTLATGMQRLGVRFEVTEAILNHVSGSRSGVAGVYQLHDWKDEKIAALSAWGKHVENIIGAEPADNVVLIASRRNG